MTDWTKEIDDFLAEDACSRRRHDADQERYREQGSAFITGTVLPAFAQLKANLERPGRDRRVDVQHVTPTRAQLTIGRPAPTTDGHEDVVAELQFTMEMAVDSATAHATKIIDDGEGPRSELLPSGSIAYLTEVLVVNDVLRHWREAVKKQGAVR